MYRVFLEVLFYGKIYAQGEALFFNELLGLF